MINELQNIIIFVIDKQIFKMHIIIGKKDWLSYCKIQYVIKIKYIQFVK